MARIGLPYFIYGLLMISLFACNQSGVSIKKGSSVDEADIVITSPVTSASYSPSQSSSIVFQGTCLKENDPVTVTSGIISQQTVCASNLWSATLDLSSFAVGSYQVLASTSSYTASVQISIQTPPTPRVIFTRPSTPLGFFNISFTMTWISVGTLAATNAYFVEAFSNSNCTGAPFVSGYQNLSSYLLAGLTVGTYYSLRVRGYNIDNVAGNPVCSSSIISDSTVPTLSLSDQTTLSTIYVRQASTKVSFTANAVARKYCISDVITSAPSIGDSCFKDTVPISVSLGAGEGLKTVYLWLADSFGNVLPTPATDTIILDSIKPATPTLVVTDPITLSTTQTGQALNNVAITGDTGAVSWCLIDTPSTVAVATPAFNDPCFTMVKPTTVTFAARGTRLASLYTQDAAGNISGKATVPFNWLVASTFTLLVDTFYPHPTVCIPITITLKNSLGTITPAGPSPFRINFTISAGTGLLYLNSTCTISSSTLTINSGSAGTIYYKTSAIETFTLDGVNPIYPANHITTTYNAAKRNAFNLSQNGQSCYIKDGIPQCWGLNNGTYFGRGFSPENNFIMPTGKRPSTLATEIFTDISAGYNHSCAIKAGGSAFCWGQNFYGQVGSGAFSVVSSVTAVFGLNSGVRTISAGNKFTCALVGDKPKCWGTNSHGELGNGTLTNSLVPIDTITLTSGVIKIQASNGFACALRNSGIVYCWGQNDQGQLGNGTTTDSSTPTPILGLTSISDFSLGETWGCATNASGMKCWGTNNEAGLGIASVFSSSTPVSITGVSSIVTNITLGKSHACFSNAGNFNCWGRNDLGQFGNGMTSLILQATPVAVPAITNVAQISSGKNSTCMVNTSNSSSCWGSNANNALGIGTMVDAAIPVTGSGLTGTPLAVSVGSTTCVTMSDGTNQCWGQGSDHQIGDGNARDSSSPVATTVSTSTSISTGELSACSVNSGLIACWGLNLNLRLGRPAVVINSNGTNVQGITSLATGIHVSKTGRHACAIVNGGVKCWGNNQASQLGIPFANDDEDVATFVTGIGAGSGATKVVSGNLHSCSLVSGAVKCWGNNNLFQLGKGNDNTPELAPITIIASGATDLSTGGNYTCAVVSAALKCWGNLTIYGTMKSPTIHPDLTSNVVAVASGEFHTCVIMNTGSVRCFGAMDGGRLGNNLATGDSLTSVAVTGIAAATAIDASSSHTCAIDGTAVKCWGFNYFGGINDGTSFATTTPVSPILEP
jgi:alpha-tubulin suppressor-like RCC1 family protein